jgi:hypothetical protein
VLAQTRHTSLPRLGQAIQTGLAALGSLVSTFRLILPT